jgi:hypothetical protein
VRDVLDVTATNIGTVTIDPTRAHVDCAADRAQPRRDAIGAADRRMEKAGPECPAGGSTGHT